MGLRVDVLRGTYDSTANAFHGKSYITIVNIAGPFEPTEDAPAARLARNAFNEPIIVPADEFLLDQNILPDTFIGPMMGGTYAGTSDSRLQKQSGIYGAVAIHDRFETHDEYRRNSL